MAFLELKQVSKAFGRTMAVEDFNLEVEKGELVSFLGPSGCGKTTTLRIVAGFEVPTQGKVYVNGEDITYIPPNKRNVGMVFQAYALFPNMTVADNIGFGLKVARKPAAEIRERVEEMLNLIHMPEFGSRYPYQLSGGQQQRVALARALAIRPEVLLLDEPLSALDAKIRVSLRAEIRAIQQKLGITAIYVTHDQEEALSLSDRVVVMNVGHIEQVGAPYKIYNFPQTEFVAQFVGTLNTLRAEVIEPASGRLKVSGREIQTDQNLDSKHTGDNIMIALRPERMSFASEGEKGNLLNCTVQNITFLGEIVRLELELEQSKLFMDIFNKPNLNLPKLGEQVQITLAPEDVLILSQTAEAVAS